jgi:5S rRNA maturation endonuclease (ribonuclease M5)
MTVQQLFEQTNGGLDIIVGYYQEAERASQRKGYKFKFRDDEKTASATMYFDQKRSCWTIKDFGDSTKPIDAFDLVKLKEGLENAEAFKFILQKFKLTTPEGIVQTPRAKYSRRAATEGEYDGLDQYQKKDEASIFELKTLFSKKVWAFLQKKTTPVQGETLDETAAKNAREILKDYRLSALDWYENVRFEKDQDKNPTTNLVAHRFASTDTYPIFMYDEGNWQKFYQPLHEKKNFRFHSSGTKPEKYVFGIGKIKSDFEKENLEVVADAGEEDERGVEKFKEIIICSGGSDALNVAALGYKVIWFNSETINKNDIPIFKLQGWAHKVYYLPDIDATGKAEGQKLALAHLNIYTIWLPEAADGQKPWKDIRDWLNIHNVFDFKNLLASAMPLQFWSEKIATNRKGDPIMELGVVKKKYTPNPVYIRNFLHQNGYGKVQMSENVEDEQFVKIEGNIVHKVVADDMSNNLLSFVEKRYLDVDLQIAIMKSKAESLSSFSFLKKLTPDFCSFSENKQLFFFQNAVWEVSKQGIKEMKTLESRNFVWKDSVIGHDVKLYSRPFEIFKSEDGEFDINIISQDCLYQRFLTNTSRTHWRTELETELDKLPADERIAYRQTNQFNIAGPLLSAAEIKEQKRHLMSKISGIGYMLHRYKKASTARSLFLMDFIMENMEESNGGTGKSMVGRAFKDTGLMSYKFIDGRKDDLKGPHLFEGITEHTDLLWLDDLDKRSNFETLFSTVDNDITVNPKGKRGYTVPFEVSPKVMITSNFPPFSMSASTLRRLWFIAFSDWYHFNKEGRYRSDHTPVMDFGKDLFRDFSEAEWNAFYNFMAYCCEAYMVHGRIEPPMDSLMSNAYRNKIGANFLNWANLFFSEENDTLDCYLPRVIGYETYRMEGHTDITSNGFKEKLEIWCRLKGFTMNPKDCKGYRDDGRITQKAPKPYWDTKDKKWIQPNQETSVEFIYLQRQGEPVSKRNYFDLPPTRSTAVAQPTSEPTFPKLTDSMPF